MTMWCVLIYALGVGYMKKLLCPPFILGSGLLFPFVGQTGSDLNTVDQTGFNIFDPPVSAF